MPFRHFTVVIGLLVHAIASLAQSPVDHYQVRLVLTDAQRQPVFGATVQQQLWSDTTQTITTISDTAGVVLLSVKADASYQLQIWAMGYKPLVQGIRPTKRQSTYHFMLQTQAQMLASVTVMARQPLMRQEDDKMIINPELMASSSTNAYELLTKTPGLFLDQEGHIYLNSAIPATIYLNGREQRMSAEDVATLLRSLPPNSVDRIEVMRTPSARYDASNAGGAVNVILKKGIKLGRTGSVSANMNQGQLGNQGVGFSVNDSDGRRTAYLNLNYSRRDNYDQLSSSRQLPADQTISQQAYTHTPAPGDALFAGYGLSYQLTPTWELNFDGRGNYGNTNSFSDNTTRIQSEQTSQLMARNLNTVQNLGHTGSLTQGLSTRFKLDSLGSELTADLSYSYLSNRTDQQYLTNFQLPASTEQAGGGDLLTWRSFVTAKADWLQKFPRKLSLEVGFKTSNQWFCSQSVYGIGTQSLQQPDLVRTNAFTYTDAMLSGYVQSTKMIGKFTLKTGLRIEHTAMDGQQRLPADTTFRVRRIDLFPYVYLNRPVVSIANFPVQLSLIYRRSITRPTYEQLNPAIRYVDPYLYETGNPALLPQFTQNVEANLNVASLPILAVGQNYSRQLFSSTLYQNPASPSLAYRTTDNLGQSRETYVRMLLGIPPGGRYFFVVTGQYNHNQYDGQYQGQPIAFNRGSWTLLTYHQLELDKRSTLQINGFWSIHGQRQFYTLGNFGTLDLSINRKFMQNKLNVTLSISDLFFTNPNSFRLQQGSVVAQGRRQGDSRRIGLSLRYHFGLKKQREESPNPFTFDGLNSVR